MNRKEASELQEKKIAQLVGGTVQPASGGTKFGGGDVHTHNMLIEAKTVLYPRDHVNVKKEWLDKAKEQAFEQGKYYSAVAIRFAPLGSDYFIIDSNLFKQLINLLESY